MLEQYVLTQLSEQRSRVCWEFRTGLTTAARYSLRVASWSTDRSPYRKNVYLRAGGWKLAKNVRDLGAGAV